MSWGCGAKIIHPIKRCVMCCLMGDVIHEDALKSNKIKEQLDNQGVIVVLFIQWDCSVS